MTDDDLEVTSENAQTFIIAVGGVLGLILGLTSTATRKVSWDPDQASFVIGDRTVSIETIRDQLLRHRGLRRQSVWPSLPKISATA
jgi:hypothetical protein